MQTRSQKKHSLAGQQNGTRHDVATKQSSRARSINIANKRSSNPVYSNSTINFEAKRMFSGFGYTARMRKQLKPSKYDKTNAKKA